MCVIKKRSSTSKRDKTHIHTDRKYPTEIDNTANFPFSPKHIHSLIWRENYIRLSRKMWVNRAKFSTKHSLSTFACVLAHSLFKITHRHVITLTLCILFHLYYNVEGNLQGSINNVSRTYVSFTPSLLPTLTSHSPNRHSGKHPFPGALSMNQSSLVQQPSTAPSPFSFLQLSPWMEMGWRIWRRNREIWNRVKMSINIKGRHPRMSWKT